VAAFFYPSGITADGAIKTKQKNQDDEIERADILRPSVQEEARSREALIIFFHAGRKMKSCIYNNSKYYSRYINRDMGLLLENDVILKHLSHFLHY
jgi:hypothetical protein